MCVKAGCAGSVVEGGECRRSTESFRNARTSRRGGVGKVFAFRGNRARRLQKPCDSGQGAHGFRCSKNRPAASRRVGERSRGRSGEASGATGREADGKTVNDQGTPMRIASSAGSGRGKKGAPVSGSEARHDRHQVAKAGGRIVQQELDSDRLVTGPATGGQASSGGHSSG